ncbi:MAG: hypothetical protein AAF847_06575 [Bacteroidota bacterium]
MRFQTPILLSILVLLLACTAEQKSTSEDTSPNVTEAAPTEQVEDKATDDVLIPEEEESPVEVDSPPSRFKDEENPMKTGATSKDKDQPNRSKDRNDSKGGKTTTSGGKKDTGIGVLSPDTGFSTTLSDSELSSLITNLSSEEIEKQVKARVIESFPDTMTLHEREQVSVVLTTNTTAAFFDSLVLQEPILKKYPERVESFIVEEVGRIMASRLIDADDAFEITPLFGNNERYIDLTSGKAQRWEWYVKPIEAGTHTLSYVMERLEVVNDNQLVSSSTTSVLERNVTVVVPPSELLGNSPPTNDLSDGADNDQNSLWIYLLLGGLALIGLLIFVLLRKKKAAEITTVAIPTERITNLIADGKTEQAIDLLVASTTALPYNRRKEITLLSSRWSSVETEMNKGTISSHDADIKRNRIHDRLLDLVHDLSR